MILLRPDCLVFKHANGDQIPCSAEAIAVELMGVSAEVLDPEVVRHAAQAVLHYFKTELGRTTVSIGEFAKALEAVLHGLGLDVKPTAVQTLLPRVVECDLRRFVGAEGEGGEIFFFTRLRAEMRRQLEQSPQVLRFRGLHECVLQLTGARRWTGPCQRLHDQIVEYLRTCLRAENHGADCALVVL